MRTAPVNLRNASSPPIIRQTFYNINKKLCCSACKEKPLVLIIPAFAAFAHSVICREATAMRFPKDSV